ncbi:hypothetical protein C3L33_02102, partial [Rhododendron williamsianum]
MCLLSVKSELVSQAEISRRVMADMDLDLDDLDGLSRVPSRISRFAPKNSKLKAKSEPQELNSFPMKKKKEEVYSIHDCETTNQDDCAIKMDLAVKMDVEAKSEGQEAKDETMEEVNDDDRVVREIDVFFTPQIDPSTQAIQIQIIFMFCNIHLGPVGVHMNWMNDVRIKPSRAEVEVDLSIDVNSKNYDTDADPRTLSSSMKPTHATGYAVGNSSVKFYFVEDLVFLFILQLHINPIRAVVQLRPSMEHLKSDGSKKKSVTCNVEATIKLEDPKDEKSAGPSKKVLGLGNMFSSVWPFRIWEKYVLQYFLTILFFLLSEGMTMSALCVLVHLMTTSNPKVLLQDIPDSVNDSLLS